MKLDVQDSETILRSITKILEVNFCCRDYRSCTECPLFTRDKGCIYCIIKDTVDYNIDKNC